jgi:hypothetical protein
LKKSTKKNWEKWRNMYETTRQNINTPPDLSYLGTINGDTKLECSYKLWGFNVLYVFNAQKNWDSIVFYSTSTGLDFIV